MSERTIWLRWIGTDRNGNHRTGFAGADDVSEWTRLHFNAGWRKLVVRSEGREVGRIERRDGKRTWWAESLATHPEEQRGGPDSEQPT